MAADGLRLWVAVERLSEILVVYPEAVTDARVRVPAEYAQVRARGGPHRGTEGPFGALGPRSGAALARDLRVPENAVTAGLHALEAQGAVLRGSFTGGESSTGARSSGATGASWRGLRALSARAGRHRTREARAAQMAAAGRCALF